MNETEDNEIYQDQESDFSEDMSNVEIKEDDTSDVNSDE